MGVGKRARQFTGFAATGVIATGIQVTLLILLHEGFGLYAVYASAIGYATSSVLNYLMKYHLVFKSQRKHSAAAPRYVLISSIGLSLNILTMYLMFDVAGLHYLAAQVVAVILVLIWGFTANALWTFKH